MRIKSCEEDIRFLCRDWRFEMSYEDIPAEELDFFQFFDWLKSDPIRAQRLRFKPRTSVEEHVLFWFCDELKIPQRTLPPPTAPALMDVGALRCRLGETQLRFAQRFGLPVHLVRAWEKGIQRPDAAARVLLKVIENYPQSVERAVLDLCADSDE